MVCTSNYDESDKGPLPISKKNELERLWKNLLDLEQKHMHTCEKKKLKKKTKKGVIKRRLMLKNYTDCLLNDKIILQSQKIFKNDCHNVHTEQINKIALSSKDDTRLQTFYKITAYAKTRSYWWCWKRVWRKW